MRGVGKVLGFLGLCGSIIMCVAAVIKVAAWLGIDPLPAGIGLVGIMLLATVWAINYYIERAEERMTERLQAIYEVLREIRPVR